MKLKSLLLALAIAVAGVGEAMGGGVQWPSNINSLPTSGLTANHFLLGDTIQGLKDSGYTTVPCASGGTGLTSGTPGGVLYFSGTCTLLSSVVMTNHALMIGGGSLGGPHPLASLGTSSQVLIGNASGDPTWGTPPPSPCAAATLSVLGCVFAPTDPPVAHKFLTGYNGTNWLAAQPDFADLTGTFGCAAIPALTGDITSTAGSCATTVAKIQTKVVSGTTGTGNVVFSASPTFTGTANFASATATGTFKSTLTGATVAGFAADGAASTVRSYSLQTNGLLRWGLSASSAPESGSQVGSDFIITRFDDTGVGIDLPFKITRSTGVVTIADGVVITGAGGTCTNQFVKSISTGMIPTCATVNLATDVTGTLPPADCPPAVSGGAIGCMFAPTSPPVTHQFLIGYNGTNWLAAQPDVSDLTGVFSCAQRPAETGDVTSPAGSCATTVAKIQGTVVGGTTGSGNVVFSAAPTLTGLTTAVSLTASGLIKSNLPNGFAIDAAAGTARVYALQTGALNRWGLVAANTPETGSGNAGSDFRLNRYDDTGIFIDAPISAIRSTGVVTIADGVVITGAGGACTNQFVKSISTSMVPTCATINLATDVTGTFGCAQMPADTGDVTSPVGSCVTTVAKIAGTTVGGTSGTGNVVFSASPTFTGIANFAGVVITGAGGTCTNQFVRSISTALAATCASVNLATDVTGTLPPADCPTATTAAIGCMTAPGIPAASHTFLIGTTGTVWNSAQPDFADLTGSISCSQEPAWTGDVTSPAGSCATTVAKIAGVTVTGATGTGNVVFSASPTLTGTALAASLTASGTIKSTLNGATVAGFAVDAAAGTVRSYGFESGGLLRWGLSASSNAESTGNLGSDFLITRFNDAGVGIDLPFKITRSTGAVTIADGVVITGAGAACTNQFVRSISTGMIATCASVNLATDVSGTLPSSACPAAVSAGPIGCMFAPTTPPVTHQFLTGYNGTVWQAAQPVFADLATTPTTLAGYGITDALKTTNNLSDVPAPLTARNNLGIYEQFLTADLAKVNITPTGSTDLGINGVAGKTYSIHAVLHMTVDATSGFRIRMGGTSTATFDVYQVQATCNSTNALIGTLRITDWAVTSLNYTGGCLTIYAVIDGTVTINAAGTITPQFALGTGTNTSTLLKGSYVEYNLLN